MACRRIGMLAIIMAAALAVPQAGHATDVLLAFGSMYASGDGGTSVHRGVDAAAAPGDEARAPATGEVSFAGEVPTRAGGTVTAVSVRDGEDVFTVMPLGSVDVAIGDTVAAGQALGTVASEGDPSSPGVHLHISMRRSGVYLDPLPYLAPASAARETEIRAEVVTQPNTAPQPGVTCGPVATSVMRPASGRPSLAAQPVTGEAPAFSAAVQPRPVANEAVALEAPVRLSEGVSLGGAQVSPSYGYAPSAGARIWRQAATALPSVAASPEGLASIAAALLAVFLLLTRRALERRIMSNPPVSDRFGSMLQHLRAGDTLCGLTSCSGLLPSQSRGRLAQRR